MQKHELEKLLKLKHAVNYKEIYEGSDWFHQRNE